MMPSATIVSLLPFEIHERKITLFPPTFDIPAATETLPGCLVIGDNVRVAHYIDGERGSMMVKQFPKELADAIIVDWVTAQMQLDDNARPGIFAVDGEHKPEEIAVKFPKELARAQELQRNWFKRLCNQADKDFQRFQSARCISDIHMYAARALAYEPTWMTLENQDAMVKCPHCRSSISALATICPQCRTDLKVAPTKKA